MEKCFLCDRKKDENEMMPIKVNGIHNHFACNSHEILPNVNSFTVNHEENKDD